MRASSWASTTTRRARSVNRSNMGVSPRKVLWCDRGAHTALPRVVQLRFPPYVFPGRDRQPSPTANNAARRARGGAGGAQCPSVSGGVCIANLAGDPSALGDLEAVGLRPLADLAGRRARRAGSRRRATSAARPAGVADVGCERLAKGIGVLGVQVDFVILAVETKGQGFVGIRLVDVIDQNDVDLLRHRGLTDLFFFKDAETT